MATVGRRRQQQFVDQLSNNEKKKKKKHRDRLCRTLHAGIPLVVLLNVSEIVPEEFESPLVLILACVDFAKLLDVTSKLDSHLLIHQQNRTKGVEAS